MLFQIINIGDPLFFVLWLILATVIVFLIMYIAVLVVVSKTKARDKWFLILLLAFIAVLVLPIIVGAIMMVLNFYRRYDQYKDIQKQKSWARVPISKIYEFKVGVMGLGEMGGNVAKKLAGLGFQVVGWSEAQEPIEVHCFGTNS